MAWRQFGWRLYGKLGVDYREKGAAAKMRKALQRNAYVTLLKVNAVLLVSLTAACRKGVDPGMLAAHAHRHPPPSQPPALTPSRRLPLPASPHNLTLR